MPTPPRCRAGWWSLVPAFCRSCSLAAEAPAAQCAASIARAQCARAGCVSAAAGTGERVLVRLSRSGEPVVRWAAGSPAPAAAWPDAAPWVVVRPRFVGARSLGRGRALRDHPRRALAVPDRRERGCGTALSARLYHDAPEVKPQGLDIWLAS
jgi:hypothetical protein